MKQCCPSKEASGSMGMPDMMKGMFGDKSGKFSPMDMCKSMMESTNANVLFNGTPEVRSLFNEWSEDIETRIIDLIRLKGQVDPIEFTADIKISEQSLLYFISKLIYEKKIVISGVRLP